VLLVGFLFIVVMSTKIYIDWQDDDFTWDSEIRLWEEVYIIIEELVGGGTTDSDGFTSLQDAQFVMNYDQVTPYHSKLIKHLLDTVEKLEAKIVSLENKLNS